MKKQWFAGCLPAGVAGLLCLLMLFGQPAAASSQSEQVKGEGDVTVLPSELFEALFGESEEELTSAERAALDALSEISLRYNRSIPDTVVTNEYDGETGRLTVWVQQYDYVASNGQTVTWIPTEVSLDDTRTETLQGPDENGSYVCCFDDLWHSDDFTLHVDFVWQVEIPAETADGLLTMPYTIARDALDQLLAYEEAKLTYDSAAEAYAAYIRAQAEYEAAKQAFDAYVLEKAEYDEKKAAYDAYLVAKAEYDAKVQAYAEYLEKSQAYAEAEKKYYEYEAFRQQYAEIYDAYERYLKELEGALSRLNILESMFVSDSHGWQFYSGVMGSTVDMVLANRDELIKYALVTPADIDAAYNATQALRPLLKGYAEVRRASYDSELARYQAEFNYYSANYTAIRDGVNALNRALRNIYYANSGLQTAMRTDPRTKDKVEHFHQFLAQLYVLSCALNDAETLDPAQTVSKYHSQTIGDLVEEAILLQDDNHAHPSGVTLPETEVKLPGNGEFPEPVEKPVKDFEDMEDPSKEGAPAVVADPGAAPVEVKDPGNPPVAVAKPEGEPPVAPTLTDEARALAEELRAGILPKRQARGEDQLFTVHQSVSCIRSITNRKTVAFYDWEGNKISEVMVEFGDPVTPPDSARSADERYTYLFLGWVPYGSDDVSQIVDLQSVQENLSLSPLYRRVEREYRITWNVNGRITTQVYHWGDTPVCPVSTDRPSDAMDHTFSGWSPEVGPGQGNAEYVAQYTETPKTYTITWILGDRVEYSQHAYGELPVCPVDTARAPDDRLYTFTGWNRSLREVTGDATYIAQYRESVLGSYNDGTACGVEYTDSAVLLSCEQPAVNFSVASQYAREQGKNLILEWGSYSVTLTPSMLASLEGVYCTKLEWTQTAGDTEEAVLFRFRCLNSAGQEVSFGQALPVTVTYTPESGMYAMVYRVSGSTLTEVSLTRYADGRAELSVSPGTQMLFRPEYTLQFSDPTENCNLTAFPPHMPAGATVELNANCTYGYEISSAVLIYADGSRELITQKSFVMPRGAVAVELNVTRIVYHISFVVDGKVVSEMDLFFGEEIPLPADPTRAEDDRYYYTFSGWSPYVTRATGENRTPVYTATFTPVEKENIAGIDNESDPFLTVMVPILCAVLVVLIVLLVLGIHFRRQIKRGLAKACKWLGRSASRMVGRLAGAMRKTGADKPPAAADASSGSRDDRLLDAADPASGNQNAAGQALSGQQPNGSAFNDTSNPEAQEKAAQKEKEDPDAKD